MNCIISSLNAHCCDYILNAPAKKFSTYCGGGNIGILATPHSILELQNISHILHDCALPYYIIGAGSNTLIADSGYNGIAIKLGGFTKNSPTVTHMMIDACKRLPALANMFKDAGLSGLEPLSGIPASLGGAIAMNAGAYGTSIADIVESILVYNIDNHNTYTLHNSEIYWGYRSTSNQFAHNIILSANLRLTESTSYDVAESMAYYRSLRIASQPMSPSLGSTFVRADNVSAGYYIDKCGLKGLTIGGAMVSPKHAGFIINHNNGTAADYLSLADACKNEVQQKFGVTLKREIIYLS